MSVKTYELAKKYYPIRWNREMIDNLHDLGRLTDAEYLDVIGGDANGEEGGA